MKTNNLKCNPDKIKVIWLGGRLDPGNGILSVQDGFALPLKEEVCSLRVFLYLV